ncbi:hypothetical protein GCM10017668_62840 [Streptomyces tuirus]|uniref:GntR C-terminal domain-containing protein n=1 Tax=Streptomyces tuirus TaxID=68278 RepID=A0A7G1NPH8_9ACTN|nr:hypothetical protein GCM10017668_62840 [Streptomyces tuirus]
MLGADVCAGLPAADAAGGAGSEAVDAGGGSWRACRHGTFRARVWRGYQEEGALARTRREHAAIHRALAARDPEAARATAAAHVGEVEQWLRAQLGP